MLPEAMLFAPFRLLSGAYEFKDDRLSPLAHVCIVAEEAEGLALFERALVGRGLAAAMDSFEQYDKELGQHYVDSSVEGHRKLRHTYLPYERGEKSLPPEFGIPSGIRLPEYLRQLDACAHNTRLSILAVAEKYAEKWGLPPDASEQLAESYDGSIDVFFRVFSHMDAERAANGEPPGRNDMMDLGHFLYVRPGVELVSDDRRMRANARFAGCPTRESRDLR